MEGSQYFSVVLEKTLLGLKKIEYHLPDMGINPCTPLRFCLGCFYPVLGTSFLGKMWRNWKGMGRCRKSGSEEGGK